MIGAVHLFSNGNTCTVPLTSFIYSKMNLIVAEIALSVCVLVGTLREKSQRRQLSLILVWPVGVFPDEALSSSLTVGFFWFGDGGMRVVCLDGISPFLFWAFFLVCWWFSPVYSGGESCKLICWCKLEMEMPVLFLCSVNIDGTPSFQGFVSLEIPLEKNVNPYLHCCYDLEENMF